MKYCITAGPCFTSALLLSLILAFWTAPARATVGACNVPPYEGEQIAQLTSNRTHAISTVAVAGLSKSTGVIQVDIAHETRRLYLVLSSGEPVIWQLTGDVARVRKIVVAGPQEPDGIAAGVTGVLADKVAFVDGRYCLRDRGLRDLLAFSERAAGNPTATASNAVFLASLPVRTGIRLNNSSFVKARIMPREVVVDGPPETPDAAPPPAGVDPLMWQTLLRFSPGGIVNLRGIPVVSPIPARPYSVLPGWAGLIQLVLQGNIKIEPQQSPGQSRSMAGTHFSSQYFVRDVTYKIVKDIGWMPAALTGGTAPDMTIAKGIPLPKGDYGHVCLRSAETDLPVAGHCAPDWQAARMAELREQNQKKVTRIAPPLPEKTIEAIRAGMADIPSPASLAPALLRQRAALAAGTDRLAGWGDNRHRFKLGDSEVTGMEVDKPIWLDPLAELLGGADSIKQIVLGDQMPCALKLDGAVVCWMKSQKTCPPQATPPTACVKSSELRATKVIDIPPMEFLFPADKGTCGRDASQGVWCWKEVLRGEKYLPSWLSTYPGNATLEELARSVIRYYPGPDQNDCATTNTGALWCWGKFYSNIETAGFDDALAVAPYPVRIRLPSPVTDVSIGRASCALLEDRTAWCWSPALAPEPRRLFSGNDAVREVVSSRSNVCVVKSYDGSVWCAAGFHMNFVKDRITMELVEKAPGVALKDIATLTRAHGKCGIDYSNRGWCWQIPGGGERYPRDYAVPIAMPGTGLVMSEIRMLAAGGQATVAIVRPTANTTSEAVPQAERPAAGPQISRYSLAELPAGTAIAQDPCPARIDTGKSTLSSYPVVVKAQLATGELIIQSTYKGFRKSKITFLPEEVARAGLKEGEAVIIAAPYDGHNARLGACAKIYPVKDISADPVAVELLSDAVITSKKQELASVALAVPDGNDRYRQREAIRAFSTLLREGRDYLHLVEFARDQLEKSLAANPGQGLDLGQEWQSKTRAKDEIPANCVEDTSVMRPYLTSDLYRKFEKDWAFDMSRKRLTEEGGSESAATAVAAALRDLAYAVLQLGDARAAYHLAQCKVEAPELFPALAKALSLPELVRDLSRRSIGLQDTDIAGLNLRGIAADGQKWIRVNAAGADLRGASFSQATLENVNFDNTRLELATYDCRTKFDAGFSPAARHMIFLGPSNCEGYRQESNLDRIVVSELCADTCPAVLDIKRKEVGRLSALGARLGMVFCSECKISDSDFSGSEMRLKLAKATVSNTSFKDARLAGMICTDSVFSNVNFSGADLSGMTVNGCKYDDKTIWPKGFDPIAAGISRIAQ